jgi:hypothetical protein
MSNAVFSITYAKVDGFPAGTVVDHIAVSITDVSTTPSTTVTQNLPPDSGSATFVNVAAGDYTFSVSGQDATNTVLGTAVAGKFSITAPATVTLSLPATASAAQA